MESGTMTHLNQSDGSTTVIRRFEKQALVDRLAHARLRQAKCELDYTTYHPGPEVSTAVAELERFKRDLELNIASEVVAFLEDLIRYHDEETRALS